MIVCKLVPGANIAKILLMDIKQQSIILPCENNTIILTEQWSLCGQRYPEDPKLENLCRKCHDFSTLPLKMRKIVAANQSNPGYGPLINS